MTDHDTIIPALMSARAKVRKAIAVLEPLIANNINEDDLVNIRATLNVAVDDLTHDIESRTVEPDAPGGIDHQDDEDEPEPDNVVSISSILPAARAAYIASKEGEYETATDPDPDADVTIRPEADVSTDPQPGDIYYTDWGYDQTNAEFFQVVARTPATVTVRSIAGTIHNRRLYPQPDVWCVDTGLKDREGVGYSEKVCRARRGRDVPFGSLNIDDVRDAWPYQGGGAHDTYASGQMGH